MSDSELVLHNLEAEEVLDLADIDEVCIRPRLRDEIGLMALGMETVCGPDDRQKVTATTTMPFNAICKLYMKSPSGASYIGSGWLTHGDKLYTAGHCVYDRKAAGWMTSITVVPGMSGTSRPYGTFQAVALMATRGWIQSGSYRYDMGAIKLASAVGHGDVITPALGDPASGEVCGYPGDRDMGLFQYRMRDSLVKQAGMFRYTIDTYGGQSGAPLLSNGAQAVAIHNYGGCPNSASDLYQDFVEGVDAW